MDLFLLWLEYGVSAALLLLWCIFEALYSRLSVLSSWTSDRLTQLFRMLVLLALVGLAGIGVHAVMLWSLTSGAEIEPAGLSFSVGSALLVVLSTRPFWYLLDFHSLRLLRKLMAAEGIRYDRDDDTKIKILCKRHRPDPSEAWRVFGERVSKNGATTYEEHAFDITRRVSPLAQAEWSSVVTGSGCDANLKLCLAMLFADLMPTKVLRAHDAPPLFERLGSVRAGWVGRYGRMLALKLGSSELPDWGECVSAGSGKTWELLVVACLEYFDKVHDAVAAHQRMIEDFKVDNPLRYLEQLLAILRPPKRSASVENAESAANVELANI